MENYDYSLGEENKLLENISNNAHCRTVQYFSDLHLQKWTPCVCAANEIDHHLMAVQWPTWRELTCLSTLELKTLHITETATRPGTFTGRGQRLGSSWRNTPRWAFSCWQTKCKASFVRDGGVAI